MTFHRLAVLKRDRQDHTLTNLKRDFQIYSGSQIESLMQRLNHSFVLGLTREEISQAPHTIFSLLRFADDYMLVYEPTKTPAWSGYSAPGSRRYQPN